VSRRASGRRPDALRFYGNEDFMEIFCVLPFMVDFMMRSGHFDDDGHVHTFGLPPIISDMVVSMQFDEREEEDADGETNTVRAGVSPTRAGRTPLDERHGPSAAVLDARRGRTPLDERRRFPDALGAALTLPPRPRSASTRRSASSARTRSSATRCGRWCRTSATASATTARAKCTRAAW